MIFESLFASIHTFLSGLSLFELFLLLPFVLLFFSLTLIGLCMVILFYRWTLRDENEDEKKGR